MLQVAERRLAQAKLPAAPDALEGDAGVARAEQGQRQEAAFKDLVSTSAGGGCTAASLRPCFLVLFLIR